MSARATRHALQLLRLMGMMATYFAQHPSGLPSIPVRRDAPPPTRPESRHACAQRARARAALIPAEVAGGSLALDHCHASSSSAGEREICSTSFKEPVR